MARPKWDYAKQPKVAVESCELCRNDVFAVIGHRDRYGFPVETHCCTSCGLIFLNPRMTTEAYNEFYRDVYRDLIGSYVGREFSLQSMRAGQAAYAERLVRLLRAFPVNDAKTLLDIGGSTGVVASVVGSSFGLAPFVLEPSNECNDLPAGVDAIQSSLEEYEADGGFSLILMCQTVDHLTDLMGGLRKIRHLVAENGVFFVDMVDFEKQVLVCNSVEKAIKIDHPYYLTDYTMTNALRLAGFRIVRKDYAADRRHIGYVCRPRDVRGFSPQGADDVLRTLWHAKGR